MLYSVRFAFMNYYATTFLRTLAVRRKVQTLSMSSAVHENVKNYYGSRLETSDDIQTNAACSMSSRTLPKSACEALKQVHPDVCKRYSILAVVDQAETATSKANWWGRGQVIGLDMTDEMIVASQKYVQYHQEKFGYSKPNTVFNNFLDVVVSNCVICLCPDKRTVISEAYKVLKEGGELYYSDMYASKAVPDSFKEDPVLWGEGMAGALYWRDLITLMKDIGFSTPHLVAGSHIVVHNPELQRKTGDVKYASGTYRIFKLPQNSIKTKALVTYKGTVPDCAECFEFDASHYFKTNVPVEVGAEMAAILQNTRFSMDFNISMLETTGPNQSSTPQYCYLSPFLLADKLGSSVKQCSKTGH
uniref:Arsenite methyltransferase n=1 Tax=Sinocyclocheilus anshuiensis TaxID=1608454 RepID=A0A671KFG0_9TELE